MSRDCCIQGSQGLFGSQNAKEMLTWRKGLKLHIKAVSTAKEFKHKCLIAKKNRRGDSRRINFTGAHKGELIDSLKNNSSAEKFNVLGQIQ